MKLYDFNMVKQSVAITRYLADQGYPIRGNRTVAKWRGGDGYNVAIDDSKGVWFDHKTQEHGSVIDIAIRIEGYPSPIPAMNALGERYNIQHAATTRKPRKKTRGECLVANGYALVKTYTYTDEDGTPCYFVDRYERLGADGRKEKEFVQRTSTAESIAGVERRLYNLPAVISAKEVYVVEGEKDADTMMRLNFVATTNSGGGKFWSKDFNRHFEGKSVVIIPDNDEVGVEHARTLYANLKGIAESVRIAPPVSTLPKGDVTDYIEKEGGTLEGLMEKLRAATEPEECDTREVAAAKLANKTPLVNYTGDEKSPQPIWIGDIVEDVKTRFLGFPRRLGSVLFDFSRKTREVLPIETDNDLHAWADRISGHPSDFLAKRNLVTWKMLYSGLMQTVTRYEGVSAAPWFPNRNDIFPTYATLPPPDPTHAAFNQFLDFFNPSSEADRHILAAIVMAPMFYTPDGSKPAFIIDTVDGQNSGKTQIPLRIAELYGEQIMGFNLDEIKGDSNEMRKRIISAEGRKRRFVLLDNLTGAIRSQTLAALITDKTVSGRASYGRGEESRPNDLAWFVTVNGAEVDTDMAVRTYTLMIKRYAQGADVGWGSRIADFIRNNRLQVFADMLDLIKSAPKRHRKSGRFSYFDETVLSAACDTDEQFAEVDATIAERSNSQDNENDYAEEVEQLVVDALTAFGKEKTGIEDGCAYLIRSADIDNILRRSTGPIRGWSNKRVRQLVNSGRMPHFHRYVRRYTDIANLAWNGKAFLYCAHGFPSVSAPVKMQKIDFEGPCPKAVWTGVASVPTSVRN